MKGKWKRGLAIVFAIALVASVGVFSADHFLKATDGEENILDFSQSGEETDVVAEDNELPTELPTEEETLVTIAQGVFENEQIVDGNEGNDIAAETEAEYIISDSLNGEIPAEETAEGNVNLTENVQQDTLTAKETPIEPIETEKSVVIAYDVIGGEFTGIGSQIQLTAVITGYVEPSYQWQYYDGNGWKNIDGETSSVYLLNVTEENSSYRWRVDVKENGQAQSQIQS